MLTLTPGRAYIVAELGINHAGSTDIAKQLINVAKAAGCDAVKFQKRTVDVVYSAEELARPRESPFGKTNGDLKRGLEFGEREYTEIDRHCQALDIPWFASCWDEASVDFIENFKPPCYKIASASLTDHGLLRHTRGKGRPIILSTGGSTMEQVDDAVQILDTDWHPDDEHDHLVLLHAAATYPARYDELNLRVMETLRKRFGLPVGWSGHETGIATTVAAVALGAVMVERHITLDRAMWGSDQAASLEPTGLTKLVRDIRLVEQALGSREKRVLDSEIPVMAKLRRKG